MRARLIIAILCFLGTLWPMRAEQARVSFVNFYPGGDVYELEGHSALRLQFPDGSDLAVSYGMFDFDAPNFVYRFVKGDTDYWVEVVPFPLLAYSYQSEGRTIVEHPIVMDSVQVSRLLDLIQENILPENKVYRYNYVKDNCATRPLGILEKALGDSIFLPEPNAEVARCSTFRQVMRYYHRNYPWYQFGIDLALGSGIDYPINSREKAFAPIVLDAQLQGATVSGRPLADAPVVLYSGHDATAGPTPWYLTPMFVFSLVFVGVVAVTARDIKRRRVTKWVDATLFSAYGLAGLLLTFLIFVSTHEATSPNWLYLWLNPLCLVVPALIWFKKCHKIVFCYQISNIALLVVMCSAWPFGSQCGNIAFLPLIGCDLARAVNYVYIVYKNWKK